MLAILGTEQAVNERVANALVHLDDPDMLLDLRKLNGKVKTLHLTPFGMNFKSILMS